MLETNGGCELPCWWGITPAVTRWQQAKGFLGLCGAGADRPDGSVLHDVMYVPLNPYRRSDYGIRLVFTEHGEVVQSIQVHSETFTGEVSEQLPQDWHRYSLDQVLVRYGEPSQMMLELWPNPPEPHYPYRLFVFYDHLGILVAYEGPATSGETFQVCPEFEQVTHLRLWLQSPDQRSSLLQLADLDSLEQAQLLSLEEAVGMDARTFYETFRDPSPQECLETPADIWP